MIHLLFALALLYGFSVHAAAGESVAPADIVTRYAALEKTAPTEKTPAQLLKDTITDLEQEEKSLHETMNMNFRAVDTLSRVVKSTTDAKAQLAEIEAIDQFLDSSLSAHKKSGEAIMKAMQKAMLTYRSRNRYTRSGLEDKVAKVVKSWKEKLEKYEKETKKKKGSLAQSRAHLQSVEESSRI